MVRTKVGTGGVAAKLWVQDRSRAAEEHFPPQLKINIREGDPFPSQPSPPSVTIIITTITTICNYHYHNHRHHL